MDAGVVAQAILRGVQTATLSTPLRCVTNITLVLIDEDVWSLFEEEALQVFPTYAAERGELSETAFFFWRLLCIVLLGCRSVLPSLSHVFSLFTCVQPLQQS